MTDTHDIPLVLEGVTKRFGAFTAVDGVDLSIAPGEIFALLGPNGAGKTTLIHCITGLARASEGRIEVFGHDVDRDFRVTRRLVGLVPQEINFDPFFTPIEALMIQMGLMGVPPDEAWAEELLRIFALHGHKDAYTRHLSGGMKRRLLVAKALVHKPRLLFLDEPTAGVDVELRRDLWRVVRRLRDEGTTIILTTHYLEEAEELADRIGVIHRGRLLLVEDRDRLMERHGERRLVVTTGEALTALPAGLPEGSTLASGRKVVVPLTDAPALEDALATLRRSAEVVDVDMTRTTLEEIFVDLISSAEGRAPTPHAADAVSRRPAVPEAPAEPSTAVAQGRESAAESGEPVADREEAPARRREGAGDAREGSPLRQTEEDEA